MKICIGSISRGKRKKRAQVSKGDKALYNMGHDAKTATRKKHTARHTAKH
jgi:hypothetical protein